MSNKIFDRVQNRRPKMSSFDLSREQKLSAEFGRLVPTYMDEIVPGDQFSVRTEMMIRLAPMIAPVMHRVNVYMHYFFVPNRITWNSWENFITGGQEGTSTPTFPTIATQTTRVPGDLPDYLGVPIAASNVQVSALPFRAYQLIWNEYFRDPNLQSEINVHTAPDADIRRIRQRCWEKDYFTSALPWAQRGPEISVPVDHHYLDNSEFVVSGSGTPNLADNVDLGNTAPSGNRIIRAGNLPGRIENLSDQTGVDINDLRTSSALQRWLEKQARGGYRYIETILTHFGKRVPDHRLQRPEYLGGGRQPVVISEVLNTSATATQPQGEMSGHGIVTGSKNSFSRTFDEHGYVIGIMSVLPRTAYQQGLMRHWLRREKTDFYWPEFAHLGEQEIQNQEIYFGAAEPEGTFGYQQRYAEMKYGCSTVHGDFRDNLDFWHMGRIFDDEPALNEQFVEYPRPSADDGPDKRIFAVPGQMPLWIQMYHQVKARRPMPYFADPRLS